MRPPGWGLARRGLPAPRAPPSVSCTCLSNISTPLPHGFLVKTSPPVAGFGQQSCLTFRGTPACRARRRTIAHVFARLHTLATTPEQYDLGLALVREELLPWARESSGYCGLIGLVDRATGKALVLTLW